MCLHVAFEATLLIEAPPTDVAAIRLLAGMNSQMPFKVSGSLEGLAAVRADEALLWFDYLKRSASPLMHMIHQGLCHTV